MMARTVLHAALECPCSIRPSELIETPDLNASPSSVIPWSSRSCLSTLASVGSGSGARAIA